MSKLTISYQFHYASECKENSVDKQNKKKQQIEWNLKYGCIVVHTFANNLLTTEGPISSSSIPYYDKIYNITIMANMLQSPLLITWYCATFTWINESYSSHNLSSMLSPIRYGPRLSSGVGGTCKSLLVILYQVSIKLNTRSPDKQKFDYQMMTKILQHKFIIA